MTLNFDFYFIDSRPLSGPSGATVLGILNNVYNQIKINKNGNDCKLVAENVRKIEISIWRRVTAWCEGDAEGGGWCRRAVHQSQCTNWCQLAWGSISIGKRRKGERGGRWVKLTVDCLGSQTDQKLNSCLTFHSKNWILHLAKKFAVRRISSSSGSRRKFFSFTTNLSNFRDLRCTFCSSRSSPRVLGALSLSAWLHPVLQPPPANKTKAQWFLIMGVTSTITTTKRHCHCPIQTYRHRYRYGRMQKQIHLSIC